MPTATKLGASSLYGNCFQDNDYTTEFPTDLQKLSACGAPDHDFGDISSVIQYVPPTPPQVDWKAVKAPPAKENMPNAKTAPIKPATNVPAKVDLDAIKTPTA